MNKTGFRERRKAAAIIQAAFKTWKIRLSFIRKRKAAIVIQAHLRGMFAREVAVALREMRRVEEEIRKREKMEEENKRRSQLLLEQRNSTASSIDGTSCSSENDTG